MFSSEIYMSRRQRLQEQIKSGVILLLGNDESPMNYHANAYPFRQDSTFLYFFGLDSPGLTGIIDIDEDRVMIFGDDLTMDDIIWTGPKPSLADRCQQVGISETAPLKAIPDRIQRAILQDRKIHFLPQYRLENQWKIVSWLEISPESVSKKVSETLIRAIVAQRSIKSSDEIRQIESALDLAHTMHTTAMRQTRPGRWEREIAGIMEGIVLSQGNQLAFPTIFSIHGETLHNHDHDNPMQAGHIAINDSGAESVLHYASDITRTIPVGGQFTSRQKEIYSVVLQMQQHAIQAIRPGIEYRTIHRIACRTLVSNLKDLGFMKGDIDEAIEANAHTLFFPHGIGHMLGLDVHDMENFGEDYVGYTDTVRRNPAFGWNSLRIGKALETGFTVTVEPGIYFIPALIDRWQSDKNCVDFIEYGKLESYRNFGGIRIEDDVFVDEQGGRVLGKPIPKSIDDVETLCSE